MTGRLGVTLVTRDGRRVVGELVDRCGQRWTVAAFAGGAPVVVDAGDVTAAVVLPYRPAEVTE